MERARRIRPSDDLPTKLVKLLVANKDYRRPRATVRVAGDGAREYIGSLAAEMGGTVWLAGWFRLSLATTDDVAARIRRDYEAGKIVKVVRTARRNGLVVEVRDGIQASDPSGPKPTGWDVRSWPQGGVHVEEDPAGKPVLELVETPGAGKAGPGKEKLLIS
jgi:hypothetical protein